MNVREDVARRWIELITEEKITGPLNEALYSGIHLCTLAKNLFTALDIVEFVQPVTKYDDPVRNNIATYLRACHTIGVSDDQCFTEDDLLLHPNMEKAIVKVGNAEVLARNNEDTVTVEKRKRKEKSTTHPTTHSTTTHSTTTHSTTTHHPTTTLPTTHHPTTHHPTTLFTNVNEFEKKNEDHSSTKFEETGTNTFHEDSSVGWEELLKEYRMQQVASDDILMEEGRPSGSGEIAYAAWCTEEKIKQRIHRQAPEGEIPSHLRGTLWMLLSGAFREMESRPGYYASLHLIDTDSEPATEAVKQIDADISRTVSSSSSVSSPNHLERLRRVLVAYSLHNPRLGYCQGLNFVVARMLFCLDEESSFWLLGQMVKILPDDYFTTMLGVAVDQHVFTDLVDLAHTQVSAHLQKLGGTGMELSLACTEWFLTLFSSPCPFEITMYVWDTIFIHGDEILFRVALALISIHSDVLLSCSTYSDALSFLNRLGSTPVKSRILADISWSNNIATSGKIEELRNYHRSKLADNLSHVPSQNEREGEGSRSFNSGKRSSRFFPHQSKKREHRDMEEHIQDRRHYAYYYDNSTPQVLENHWTSRYVRGVWSEYDSEKALDNGVICKSPTITIEGVRRMDVENSGGHVRSPQFNNLNWRQRLEEWHKDKKLEKQQKVIQKRSHKDQQKIKKKSKRIEPKDHSNPLQHMESDSFSRDNRSRRDGAKKKGVSNRELEIEMERLKHEEDEETSLHSEDRLDQAHSSQDQAHSSQDQAHSSQDRRNEQEELEDEEQEQEQGIESIRRAQSEISILGEKLPCPNVVKLVSHAKPPVHRLNGIPPKAMSTPKSNNFSPIDFPHEDLFYEEKGNEKFYQHSDLSLDRPVFRRHASAPVAEEPLFLGGERMLRERQHVISYLQRKAGDAEVTEKRDRQHSNFNGEPSSDSPSFLGRLSLDLESCIGELSRCSINNSKDTLQPQ